LPATIATYIPLAARKRKSADYADYADSILIVMVTRTGVEVWALRASVSDGGCAQLPNPSLIPNKIEMKAL
jgi:hypothetical protein